jgi:hypothetical protein
MTVQQEQKAAPHTNDAEITLIIQTVRGDKTHTFPKQAKIAEVIAWVVKECGFAAGDRFELVLASNPQEVLQPERPLVSFQLEDNTRVILTMFGSGV